MCALFDASYAIRTTSSLLFSNALSAPQAQPQTLETVKEHRLTGCALYMYILICVRVCVCALFGASYAVRPTSSLLILYVLSVPRAQPRALGTVKEHRGPLIDRLIDIYMYVYIQRALCPPGATTDTQNSQRASDPSQRTCSGR